MTFSIRLLYHAHRSGMRADSYPREREAWQRRLPTSRGGVNVPCTHGSMATNKVKGSQRIDLSGDFFLLAWFAVHRGCSYSAVVHVTGPVSCMVIICMFEEIPFMIRILSSLAGREAIQPNREY